MNRFLRISQVEECNCQTASRLKNSILESSERHRTSITSRTRYWLRQTRQSYRTQIQIPKIGTHSWEPSNSDAPNSFRTRSDSELREFVEFSNSTTSALHLKDIINAIKSSTLSKPLKRKEIVKSKCNFLERDSNSVFCRFMQNIFQVMQLWVI